MRLWIKWRLVVTTLPFVAVMIGLGLARDAIGLQGLFEFGDIAAILTAGAFLIGFMLSGTMADYKESEKLPGELACALDNIEDCLSLAAVKQQQLDLRSLRTRLGALSAGIERWLYGELKLPELFEIFEGFQGVTAELERGGSSYGARVAAELAVLRKSLTRIHVIRTTQFLGAGYALLETMVSAILFMMLAAHWKSPASEYTLMGFITLVYVYMVRLIRDVDCPFDHGRDGARGSAEVDLSPILDYLTRARRRLETTAGHASIRIA